MVVTIPFKAIAVLGKALLSHPFGAYVLLCYGGHWKVSLSAYALKASQYKTLHRLTLKP